MNTTVILSKDDIIRFFQSVIKKQHIKDPRNPIYVGKTVKRAHYELISGGKQFQSIYVQVGQDWIYIWQVFYEKSINDTNFESYIDNVANNARYFDDGNFLILYETFDCVNIFLDEFITFLSRRLIYTNFKCLSLEQLRKKSNELPENIDLTISCPADL